MLKWFRQKEENKIEENKIPIEEPKESPEIEPSHENKKGFFGRLKERLDQDPGNPDQPGGSSGSG